MRRLVLALSLPLVLIFVGTILVSVANAQPVVSDLTLGAQFYDKWYAVLGVSAPAGDMPIWSRQSTNTRSGEQTWRCSECHGWDYKGVSGAYSAGSHKTGFPSLMNILPNLSQEEIIAHLKGEKDPAHDFSAYLDEASMQKVALFLKEGLIDDSEYIDVISLKVIAGSSGHGRDLYQAACAQCHGEDGKTIIFRTEGVQESLGAVARRDPFRFLHRTRFGVAGSEMPVGYDLGWTPADGRDVLADIRSDDDLRTIPVVVMTASTSGEDRIESERLEVEAYLTKPVDLRKFLALVKELKSYWREDVALPILG